MKRYASLLLCIVLVFSISVFDVSATETNEFIPYVTNFVVTTETNKESNTRATGLIYAYRLTLSQNGTTLNIGGQTSCSIEVVKCGFKDLVIQRRKNSSDSWSNYYDYGNVYVETNSANLSTTLVVESGYQYRISCKHYAKKNLLSTQTISNTSTVVAVS